MRKYLLILSWIVAIATGAENITGVVVDEKRNPLPYATVQIPRQHTGVLCDSVGNFAIIIDSLRPMDSLRVSYLGYFPRMLAPGQISDKIILEPASTGIPEVVVVPKDKVKKRKKGKRHSWSVLNIMCVIDGETAGESFGYEFHAKKGKELVLYKVGFFYNKGENQMTSMKFRINVYNTSRVKDNDFTRDFVPVLPEPIYFDFELGEERKGKFEYTLPESILLPRDAMVEIEMLENLGDKRLYYRSNAFGKGVWGRSLKDNYWSKTPFVTPFFVECLEMEER